VLAVVLAIYLLVKSPDNKALDFSLKSNRHFPFRYFKDQNGTPLRIAAVTAPFRSYADKNRFYAYKQAGIETIGVTAYKTFPLKITDPSEDKFHQTDGFEYTKNIKVWLTCFNFNNPKYSGLFNKDNHLIDISESDFYDLDTTPEIEKKYDYVYICLKDSDGCPLDGWQSNNRNFKLALKCFPIFKSLGLRGLAVGRVGCDIEKYNIETTDFLQWNELQQRIRQSRFLFVPNIDDASPRVIAEAMTKGVPVVMNRNIVGGGKYITLSSGEFFNDESDVINPVVKVLSTPGKYDTRRFWSENYGSDRVSRRLSNFLKKFFPERMNGVETVSFI
jgi:glycosyltransferase involved in cell wall biosynthesis